MLAADDGVARTMAQIHELQVWWDDPTDSPDRGRQLYRTLAPIVTEPTTRAVAPIPISRAPGRSLVPAGSICVSPRIEGASSIC